MTTMADEKWWPCACTRRDDDSSNPQMRLNAPEVNRCEECGTTRIEAMLSPKNLCLSPEVRERIRQPQAPLRPARNAAEAQQRTKYVEKIRAARGQVALIFKDCEQWNERNPDKRPIDPDPNGDLAALLTMYDAMLRHDTQ